MISTRKEHIVAHFSRFASQMFTLLSANFSTTEWFDLCICSCCNYKLSQLRFSKQTIPADVSLLLEGLNSDIALNTRHSWVEKLMLEQNGGKLVWSCWPNGLTVFAKTKININKKISDYCSWEILYAVCLHSLPIWAERITSGCADTKEVILIISYVKRLLDLGLDQYLTEFLTACI